MSRRRSRRKSEKARRHALVPSRAAFTAPAIVREASRVKRLAYTRRQAAEALGISASTFNRRVLPFIETLEMDWGTRLVPVDELERFVAERRQEARVERGAPARPGRRAGVPPEVVARVQHEYAKGRSLGEIARGLNNDGIETAQGGRQWWPSTVRAVLVRSSPRDSAERR